MTLVNLGGISLLHLSWSRLRRALPAILALWSSDFPHEFLRATAQLTHVLIVDELFPHVNDMNLEIVQAELAQDRCDRL